MKSASTDKTKMNN